MGKEKFYFVSLNLLRKSHKNLIKWIKYLAKDNEISISSFCIGVLKKEYERQKESGGWTDPK